MLVLSSNPPEALPGLPNSIFPPHLHPSSVTIFYYSSPYFTPLCSGPRCSWNTASSLCPQGLCICCPLLGTLFLSCLPGWRPHFTQVFLLKLNVLRGAFPNQTILMHHLAWHSLPPYPALIFISSAFFNIDTEFSLLEGRQQGYWLFCLLMIHGA